MSDTPWLTIIGIGDDGVAGLGARSQAALAQAKTIMGAPRHLDLLGETRAETLPWPVPFSDGIDILMQRRGQPVVVLASGDPFWFGAGTVLSRHLEPQEWVAHPGVSCFALAANRLGWALERTTCLGLHAAPLPRLRRHLAPGAHLIVTLRDGAAVPDLAAYLSDHGFGESTLSILEHLGGPSERISTAPAHALGGDYAHPVCAAIAVAGHGPALSVASGQNDDVFEHDGQITKRPIRAMTLSALSPRPHAHLWDIGSGSGSIALEWLLSAPSTYATSIECRDERAARILHNAMALGVEDRLTLVRGTAPEALDGLAPPDAVFVGGGLSDDLLAHLSDVPTRLVVNAVTLESEALLANWQARRGGTLMRVEVAQAKPLGTKRGWSASYPLVQWSVGP